MTPERWARLRGAIESALTETIPERQEAALGEACAGDPALLSEARSILRAARSTHDFLGAPARLTGEDAGAPVEDWPTLLGRTLGHYQIQERLGAGGMGEVFRARDLALGRESAVKVLPRLVRPELRRRLLREAEVAARLQHPSIATFFEAGEDQGEAFIAMEFVQGQTLRARLRKGPLSFDESLSWRAAFSALSATRMPLVSCTATSSPRTSWSRDPGRQSCWTSGSPAGSPPQGPGPNRRRPSQSREQPSWER